MDKVALNKLADYLSNLNPKGFYMGAWIARGNYSGILNNSVLRKAVKNDFKCGMAACIGGHAAILFPRRLKIRNGLYTTNDQFYAEHAFAKAFGLCTHHAEEITLDHNFETPKQGAKFIRNLIKENPSCCTPKGIEAEKINELTEN